MKRDAVNRGLTIADIQEGDIFIMLGNTIAASIVCCCLRSWWSSHVGQVVRLDGQLWLGESTINSNFNQWVRPGLEPVHDGVCATKIEDSFAYYNAIDVYRPTGITHCDIQTMRAEFIRLYGFPYKHVINKFGNKCGCVDEHAPRAYGCSDLIHHLFATIGHVKPDMYLRVWGDDFVRPLDITRVIECDRIGHIEGVYAIGDPRSWCMRIAPTISV